MSTEATARLIAAVRDGSGGELFPPVGEEVVVRGRRWMQRKGWLGGAADAARLARALAEQRFAPWRRLVAQLDEECARWRRRLPEVNGEALQLTSARLTGALLRDAYTACARANARAAAQLVRKLGEGFVAAMRRFVERLRRDLRSGLLGAARAVTELVAHAAETHHGRQFVIEVALRGGARWLYKPRPADGERVMFALFTRMNRLRPAAGAPSLPVLRVVPGSGRDGAFYGWHEWVAPPRPRELAPLPGAPELRALRLSGRRAERFWYGAGCLAAACFAFGATDLFAENLRIGRAGAPRKRGGRGAGELRPYPIDLEMIAYPLRRLVETGLIGGAANAPHPGLAARRGETSGRDDDGPLAFFAARRGAALTLGHNDRPWLRDRAPELIANARGQCGYAPYLTAVLRGLFDQWVTLVQRKAALRRALPALPAPRVRVVVRPTVDYARVLDAALLGARAAAPRWSRRERAQLARLDVPAFARQAGGPLLELRVPEPGWGKVEEQPFATPYRGPVPLEERLEGASLAMLGVALRDVVESAGPTPRLLVDRRRGVEVLRDGGSGDGGSGDGEVRMRWREAGREVRFRWRGASVRVELVELGRGAAAPALRRQLLRMDRLDSALRERFQNSGFSDRATERTMEQLVARGVAWLDEVLATHGWPGRALVGERAAAAACRLVQHADRFPAFQRKCLPLVEEAVARGEATPRQLAYLTDQVRLRARQKQRYGTKFRRLRGQLVPFPIEDEANVDRRRREMGLEPMADYTRRVRRTFGAAEQTPAAAREAV